MTNFEKYKDEIEKLENKYSFTLDLDGNVVNCNNIGCYNCKFQGSGTCKNDRFNWLFKEYKEPILSSRELDLIKALSKATNKEYRYLARQEGKIYLFTDKPFVHCSAFGNSYTSNCYFAYGSDKDETLFQNIENEIGIYDIENKTFTK